MIYIDERVDEWKLNHSNFDYENWEIRRELRQQNEIKMTQIVKNYRLQQRRNEKTRIAKAKIEKKTRIAKKKTKIFVCKRCFEKYFNNIKFHEHVRTKHAKREKFISITIALSTSSVSFFLHFRHQYHQLHHLSLYLLHQKYRYHEQK